MGEPSHRPGVQWSVAGETMMLRARRARLFLVQSHHDAGRRRQLNVAVMAASGALLMSYSAVKTTSLGRLMMAPLTPTS